MIDYDTGDAVQVSDSPAGDPTEVCLVNGGSLGSGDLGVFGSSSITMSGGTVGDAAIANDFSTFTMSGGEIPGGLYSHKYASVTMSGGIVGNTLFASEESSLMIKDGMLAAGLSIIARDSSTITIVGDNFEVDEVPVPFGDLTALSGTLTGALPSGNSFYSSFYRGGACGEITCAGTITLVPEPSTFFLLGLGLTGLAVQRRRGAL